MKKKLLALLCIGALLATMLCGCGAGMDEAIVGNTFYSKSEEAFEVADGIVTSESAAGDGLLDQRKLIKTLDLRIETENYDESSAAVAAAVTACNGYVEYSELSGNSRSNRYASYTIRVPAQNLEKFSQALSGTGTVVSQSAGQRDITLTYVDTEAHLTALKTEQESLLRLLEAAESVEDIIYIQSELTQVRYEIESYESQLRTYDDLVDYATVTLSLTEVTREQTVAATNSVWDTIGKNLKDAVYGIGQFFRGLFVLLVSALPYLAVIAVITLPILYFAVLRPVKKRRKACEQRREAEKREEQS